MHLDNIVSSKWKETDWYAHNINKDKSIPIEMSNCSTAINLFTNQQVLKFIQSTLWNSKSKQKPCGHNSIWIQGKTKNEFTTGD